MAARKTRWGSSAPFPYPRAITSEFRTFTLLPGFPAKSWRNSPLRRVQRMYSVVLAAVLTTGANTPEWGHGCFGCHGCHGCFGCYGGNAFSCYGCGGCFGCYGCYGCYGGCYGCY